jgi:hypothetical protein
VSSVWLCCTALLELGPPHQGRAAAVAIGWLQHPDFSTSTSAKPSQSPLPARAVQSLVYQRHRLLKEPTSPYMKMEPLPAPLQVLRQACIPLLGAVGLYPVDGCPVTAGQDDEVSTTWQEESMHSP